MNDRELLAFWDLAILCAEKIGSVTLSKEFILAIDNFINRQKAEIERLKKDNEYILMQHAFQRRPSGDCWNDVIEKAKAEAVKEFAEIIVADYPEMEYYLNELVKNHGGNLI